MPEEIDVELIIPNREAIRETQSAGLMIDDYNPSSGLLRGVVLDRDLPTLLDLGYPVEVLPETDTRAIAALTREPSGYPTMAQYVSFMTGVVAAHPVIAKLDTFGYSQGGRPLLMMKISKRAGWEEAKPKFCYISTMHGDEVVGMMFLMWFIDSLTDNYGTDPRITCLVDSCEIYINPLLNPDGYVAIRRTMNNLVDMNRNFPVPDGVRGDDNTFTAYAETKAIIDWFKTKKISYTINHHGGALLVNYPWDHTVTRCPDDSLYKFLAINYSSRNPPMFGSSSFPNGITNGFDWYEVNGSLQDWTYWTNGDLHLTVELGNTKTPTFSTLPSLWNNNYDAFCAAIEVILNHGVNGVVTDSISGDSLDVTVRIIELQKNVYSTASNGYYHRILLPGTYNLKFTRRGYYDKILAVTVPDSGLARLDVKLAPMNPIYVYQTNFETDSGGFVTTALPDIQDWRYGTPSQGIIEPYSGTKVWGTILTGDYSNTSQSRLILNSIELPDVDSLTLSYMQWFSFQDIASGEYHDGGNLKLWLSPTESVILSPTPGYDFPMSSWNRLIPYEMAFAGLSKQKWWHEVRVDITPWAGQTVGLSWDFGSSSANVQVGWFIDDIAIYYPDTTALHHAEEQPAKPEIISMSAYPNPFNSAVRIAIDFAGEGYSDAQMEIFDLTGRKIESIDLVSKLIDKSHSNSLTDNIELVWMPEKTTVSGVYLLRAKIGEKTITKRVVYLK
jgi:hypothetical protein